MKNYEQRLLGVLSVSRSMGSRESVNDGWIAPECRLGKTSEGYRDEMLNIAMRNRAGFLQVEAYLIHDGVKVEK
jgi:hypothetical protein